MADDGPGKLREDPADEAHRPREQAEQRDDLHEGPERDIAGRDPPGADREHQDHSQGRKCLERLVEPGADVAGRDALGPQLLGLLAKAAHLGALAPEGLHDERPVDRLVRHGGHVADPLLDPPGGALHLQRERAIHQAERGHRQEPDQREEGVGRHQRDEREQDQEDHADRERDRVEDLDRRLDIGLHVREQLAGRPSAVVGEREVAVSVRDALAQRRGHGRSRHAAVVAADPDADRPEGGEPHHRADPEPDGGGVHAFGRERWAQDPVGHPPEGDRDCHGADRVQERPEHGDRERPRVHPDVRDDQAHAAAEQVPRALALVGKGRFRPVGLGGFHEAIHDAGRHGLSTRRRPHAASALRAATRNSSTGPKARCRAVDGSQLAPRRPPSRPWTRPSLGRRPRTIRPSTCPARG